MAGYRSLLEIPGPRSGRQRFLKNTDLVLSPVHGSGSNISRRSALKVLGIFESSGCADLKTKSRFFYGVLTLAVLSILADPRRCASLHSGTRPKNETRGVTDEAAGACSSPRRLIELFQRPNLTETLCVAPAIAGSRTNM